MRAVTSRHRIAVIGGGPGGAQCARRLAEAGVDVTVFEPRVLFEKACGGGIPVRGMKRFPFLFDTDLPGKEIRQCLVVSPSGREARLPLVDPLYVFSRGVLHSFMLSRAASAGARVVQARVVSFQDSGDAADGARGAWNVRVVTTGQDDATAFGPFDFLVAADGAAGAARRHLLASAAGAKASQGIGYYLPGVSEEFLTLKFYPRLHGYLWVFPRPDHSSAGICATLGALPAAGLKGLMDGFLQERYPPKALATAERYAALIPGAPRDPGTARLQGDGWALIGDAAHLVDPLTREGIYYAMVSGDLLAEALCRGRPELYEEAWARHGAGELSWAAAHADRFFDTRFLDRLVFLAAASPAVARVLSDLISGGQAYTTLKRRLLRNVPLVTAQLARRAVTAPLRRCRDS
jgi:geranylgeranyl diphosphate/geranylgeranyl-bacteriochlorophyllide a reductase